jgi:hypothetical protein
MDLVYGWCVPRIEPEKLEEWRAMLSDPLPGREKAAPAPFQAEQEAADFMATMAMHATRTAV